MHKTKKKTPILDQPDVLHRRGYILGKHQIPKNVLVRDYRYSEYASGDTYFIFSPVLCRKEDIMEFFISFS